MPIQHTDFLNLLTSLGFAQCPGIERLSLLRPPNVREADGDIGAAWIKAHAQQKDRKEARN
jgi:hypothetical protein